MELPDSGPAENGATKAASAELGKHFAATRSTIRRTSRKRSAPEESMGVDGRAAHPKRTKRLSKNLRLPEDTAVTVRGLKGAPQHNGKLGRIIAYRVDRGHYEVALSATHHLLLRPANVSKVQEPEPQLRNVSVRQRYQPASNCLASSATLAFVTGNCSRLTPSSTSVKGPRAARPRRRPSNVAAAADNAIRFYNSHEPFYQFSNFWPCQGLMIDGKRYPTTEHYFQAQKFAGYPDLVEKCRKLPTARQCFRMVRDRRYLPYVRQDWHRGQTPVKNRVMAKAVEAKFKHDRKLMELLLSTGSRTIIEHTVNDDYWGDGGVSDWRMGMQGNHLGRILMDLRAYLRRQMELA